MERILREPEPPGEGEVSWLVSAVLLLAGKFENLDHQLVPMSFASELASVPELACSGIDVLHHHQRLRPPKHCVRFVDGTYSKVDNQGHLVP